MRIKVGSELLAQDALVADAHAAPPSDLTAAEETTIQESKPINRGSRKLYNRQNASGKLSFTVRPRYTSLSGAAAAVLELAGRKGTTGTLSVWAHGVYVANSNPQTTPTASRTDAIIRRVEARQIGVTVEVHYEIEW